jgi:hypothetical protein
VEALDEDLIEHLSWIHIVQGKVLFVKAKKRDVFYAPGARRQQGRDDKEVLKEKILKDLCVVLKNPLELIEDFSAPAHGKDQSGEGTMVEVRCYRTHFDGHIFQSHDIEAIRWCTSRDKDDELSPAALATLQVLRSHGLIY